MTTTQPPTPDALAALVDLMEARASWLSMGANPALTVYARVSFAEDIYALLAAIRAQAEREVALREALEQVADDADNGFLSNVRETARAALAVQPKEPT